MLVLLCALVMGQTTQANDKGGAFTPKYDESHYLAGAVPVENGKVVFRYTLQLPGLTRAQIYAKVKEWLARSEQQDRDIIIERSVIKDDPATGEIYVQNQEELIFAERGLSLDKADFAFLQHYTCSDGKCELEVSHLRYVYENDNKVPEGWITDDYALDKKRSRIIPGVLRPRVKTVDRMNDLFTGLNNSFMVSIAQVQPAGVSVPPAPAPAPAATPAPAPAPAPAVTPTPPTAVPAPSAAPAGATKAPVPTAVVPPIAPAPAQALAPKKPVAETPAPMPEDLPAGLPNATVPLAQETSVAETPAPTPGIFPGYTHYAADQIPGNVIQLLEECGVLLTIGNDATLDMAVAEWGGLGVLFDKPVTYCFVTPGTPADRALAQNGFYTISFFANSYKEALKRCEALSGSDTLRIKAAGLTPVLTPTVTPTMGEAFIVIECHKLLQQPLTHDQITDASESHKWVAKPVPSLYIGEILNVWIKK